MQVETEKPLDFEPDRVAELREEIRVARSRRRGLCWMSRTYRELTTFIKDTEAEIRELEKRD